MQRVLRARFEPLVALSGVVLQLSVSIFVVTLLWHSRPGALAASSAR